MDLPKAGALPTVATPHIPKPTPPVGATRNGRIKIQNSATGETSWRQGRTGFSKDWEGDPTSKNYNVKNMKKSPRHSTHEGRQPWRPKGT